MLKFEFDRNKEYQSFTGIGASGAWWAQLVGKWTSVQPDGTPTKDKIAALLYDKKHGIGMNIYRYNLGAGSMESGKGSYSDRERRAECFETAPGRYDWSRDSGAVYMMKKCVEAGADEVVLFVNSPLERLTANGMGHCSKSVFSLPLPAGPCNLPKSSIPEFCGYCLDAAEHFSGMGIPVKYISPVNEPLWIWTGGQEGCHYAPAQAAEVMRAFAVELDKRENLKNVKLSGLENGDIRWFNKSYTRGLMKYPEVREKLDGIDIHSYCLPSGVPFLDNRTAFLKRWRRWLDRKYPGVPVKMSEWCHMKGGRDCGMDSALVTANVMLEDMLIQNASSWQHWIACSCYDYCDGLIYIDNEKEDFEITKRYYVTGNFSKYIPLGAKRIEVKSNLVKCIAFTSDTKTVVVAVNDRNNVLDFSYDKDYFVSVTDEKQSLAEYRKKAGEKITIPAKSVSTFIFENRM